MTLKGGCGEDLDKYLTDLIHRSTDNEVKEKWINPDIVLKQRTQQLFPNACRNHHVFDPSTQDHPKTCVTIRSIRGTQYEGVSDRTSMAVYAGGPGSMIGAALNSTARSLSGDSTNRVMYVTYDFKHSNARSSAHYFHIRHSNALSADSLVRGPNILFKFCRRQLMSSTKLEAEARMLDYLLVDISMRGLLSSPSHCLNTLRILAAGLYHTYRNVLIDAVRPANTDWAHSRNYSKCSVPVLRYLELIGRKFGITSDTPSDQPSLLIGTESDTDTPKAIHAVFDERGAKHVELLNESLLKANQIASRELSSSEVSAIMNSENHDIYKAYIYPGDGRISADLNVTLKEIVEKTGNTWQEGVAVESVYIDESGVRDVMLQDIRTKKMWYQPCSSVVLSLGYSARYEFEQPKQLAHSFVSRARSLLSYTKWKVGLSRPVPRTTITAGCSGYFLVRGKIPIIGGQNSYWTEVAYSPEEDLTLAKLACGGNIGSEYIPATYALNNLEHLKKLFKDRLVDVLSIESCPRAINPKNDIQFYRLAPGLIISQGLGGTGMTKSGANGALSYLLSTSSISSADHGIPGHPNLFKEVNTNRLVNECTTDTMRALNLINSFSATELLSLCVIGLGAGYAVRRACQSFIHHCKRSHFFRPNQPPTHATNNPRWNLRLFPNVLKSISRI